MRPYRNSIDDDDDSFGPGTDLIISLLAILLITISLGSNFYQRNMAKANVALEEQKRKNELAESKVRELKKTETPIINIPATSRYQFESRSAILPQGLGSALSNELAPEIDSIVREYQVDVVEVIGHTDGQRIVQGSSNLDSNIEKVATENQDIGTLIPGSNADLGLMRALSVIRELQKNPKLKGLKFRAYSSAQLTLPEGGFAPVYRESDPTRRRIEIRFTRLGKVRNIN
jgi:outer membrane protein OmpA-like peptidoglycan-associated protein